MTSPIDLGILLGLAYQAFTDELRADLRTRGFTDLGSAYGYVFRALSLEPLHLQELATRLDMTAQGAAKIVNEMVERGYVERKPDPEDGRAKQLRLASRGRAALAAARRFHATYERRLRAQLGENTVDETRRLLDSMIARAGTDGPPPPLRAL
jgi:DNA-binding MarR family transcriptional regulator